MALAAAAGCTAVIDAREAQRAVSAKAVGLVPASGRTRLAGMGLADLVDFALTNRPEMASAYYDVVDAHLAMLELEADAPLASSTPWKAPSLSAKIGRSASSKAAHFDGLKWHTDGGASGSLSLDVLVWDFGRNRAQVAAQAESVVASELRFSKEGFSVFEEVASAYFGVLEADALLDVALTNEFECAEHLRQAEDRLAAGEAKTLDVLRAKTDLAAARESSVAASNGVATAGAEFVRALGLDVSVATREDVLPRAEAPLGRMPRAFAESGFGAAEAFAFARTNAPSAQVARAKLRAASDRVDYAVADLMPSVSATASLEWSDPLWLWRWGVGGVQSVFEGWRKTAAVDRAVAAMLAADAEVDRAEQELSLAAALAVAERDGAREALAAAEESVRQAKEGLDTALAQFDAGEASRVDVADATSAYAEALGSRVKAFYRGQKAEAKLFSVVGVAPRYAEGAAGAATEARQ